MTRLLAIAALTALMALSGVVARAQDSPEPTPAVEGRVLFCMGADTETCYELDPSVAVNACIEMGAEDAIRSTETVILRLFGRTVEPGQFEVLGDLETALTEDLGSHPIGYCIPMGDIGD